VEKEVIAGRYRLGETLGGGITSEVWAATDLELDRAVAVKLLARDADPRRFRREAKAVGALAHPNICTLYDYGETDGRPFMVLESLPGGSLEDRLAAGSPLPDDETEGVARDVAAGLAYAHAHGIVHRDLKPANVLFDASGNAELADFGIAQVGDEAGLTSADTVLGTAAYLAPERAAGEPATAASDVYAFGVTLFRMLTGRLPFESPNALELAGMHRDRPPPSVTEFRDDPPVRLESLAFAALAKSPSDRPADGSALVAELGRAPRLRRG
jgi:eukaryotic-like serine/threonine-protein kinase